MWRNETFTHTTILLHNKMKEKQKKDERKGDKTKAGTLSDSRSYLVL